MEDVSSSYARGKVLGPAIGLMVVCALSLTCLLLALTFDLWLVVSGAASNTAQARGGSQDAALAIRIFWSILMVVANVAILAGAVQMQRLRGRGFAMTACILALIPCFGPCFVLGIPFGIWGLVALNDPQVRSGFGS